MKVLVFGANGFVGRSISAELDRECEVWKAVRHDNGEVCTLSVDLLNGEAVSRAINEVAPDVIINAAGIVDNSEASALNVTFTQNILGAIVASQLVRIPKVIICGSAAEYGYVSQHNIPVDEDCPTVPFSIYGINKHEETKFALKYGSENNIDVVIARIFNPIGAGMADKFIIPRLLAQIKTFTKKADNIIEISRKDAVRDYVDVRDLASAFRLITENQTQHNIYNIGSGVGITNEELVSSLLQHTVNGYKVTIIETSAEPERAVASQANIGRLMGEFGWQPRYTLSDSIEGIVNGKK